MSLEKRQINVEFTAKDKCVLTTLFKQECMTLQKNDIIDLISLEKVGSGAHVYADPPCALYGICSELDQGGGSHIVLEVYATINDSGRPECWGVSDLYEKSKCFRGTIWNQ